MKRIFILLAMASVLGGAAWLLTAREPEPLNVLLIQVDTLRADRLGCYGYTAAHTPRIDSLAERGTLFEQNYANATYTAASVPSMMTGTYQDRHGLWFQGDTVSGDNVMFTEVLRGAGYDLAAIIANPVVSPAKGYTQGIDRFEIIRNQAAWRIVDRGLKWFDDRDPEDERPFFLFLQILDPHFPYWPPKGETLKDQIEGEPEDSLSWQRKHLKGNVSWNIEQILWGELATEEHVRRESILYDAEIRYTDEQIGRVLDYLDETGLRDSTLVVFTSDHGEEFFEHGFFCSHGHSTYDPVARIPLIFDMTGEREGRSVEQVVRTVDIAPTILELAGVTPMAEIDGRSLAPLIRNKRKALPDLPAFIANGPIHEGFFKERPRMYLGGIEGAWRSVRHGDWKLIVIPNLEQDIVELYNLREDPLELEDLAAHLPGRVEELMAVLEQIRTRVPGDELQYPEQTELNDEDLEMLESIGYLAR